MEENSEHSSSLGFGSPSSKMDYIHLDPSVCPTNHFDPFRKEDIDQSIPSRFEHIAATFPNRLAVKTQSENLTYGELNQAANQIARAILDRCGEGQEPIALFLEQGASLVSAILGTLKAGKFYVPLDPTYPLAYSRSILGQSGSGLIVTNDQNQSLAEELLSGNQSLINLNTLESHPSAENLELSLSPETLAVLLYTSGSTGEPKGAIHTHRNLLVAARNYTNWIHICPDDRLILCHSCSFAHSVRTFYGGLLSGASLFPYSISKEGLAPLADWMIRQKMTVFRTIPTTFRHFVDVLKPDVGFPDIRILHLGGETVTSKDVAHYKRLFPADCLLTFALGPTESFTIRRGMIDKNTPISGGIVPAGYAVEDMEVYLIDENDKRIEGDGIGEIVVKSRYLSPGYWKNPDLTTKTFRPDPIGSGQLIYHTGDLGFMRPDGCLVHIGRKDFQIKIRGFRVEVTQVEIALLEFDEVKEAVVQPKKDDAGQYRLIAYVVPATGLSFTPRELRQRLVTKLPDYMVPSAFVMLDELPLTTTGKVDRRALPDPVYSRPDLDSPFVAPRNPTEEEVSRIWENVLGIEKIGMNDMILELGGDSLRATKLISRISEKFHVNIPIQTLMETPTVAEMAEAILKHQANLIRPEEMERLLDEVESSSENQ